MSRNNALASLTANYTDSEDEDHSPLPFTELEGTSRDDGSETSQINGGSQDGLLSGQSRSIDHSRDSRSGNTNTLVSYHLDFDLDMDLIDDHAIDDFPTGICRDFQPEDDGDEQSEGKRTPGTEPRSPALKSPNGSEALETISSEDEVATKKTVTLPPEPPGKCSAKLQEKFTRMYEQKTKGQLNMNEVIQTKKMFRNPSIYEKLISHLEIDEFGTNYPEHMYNPHEWQEGSFYDELAKTQKTEMDRREKERRDRTKVDFVSGTAKKILNLPAPSTGGLGGQPEEAKRKSKWDQRGVMPLLMNIAPAAVPHPPSGNGPAAAITSIHSVTTKSKTVTTISAFGNLAKKK